MAPMHGMPSKVDRLRWQLDNEEAGLVDVPTWRCDGCGCECSRGDLDDDGMCPDCTED